MDSRARIVTFKKILIYQHHKEPLAVCGPKQLPTLPNGEVHRWL